MISLLIILLFLATFSAGAVFGFVITMADYEKKIIAGEYFTPEEKLFLDQGKKKYDGWALKDEIEMKAYAKQQREEFGMDDLSKRTTTKKNVILRGTNSGGHLHDTCATSVNKCKQMKGEKCN